MSEEQAVAVDETSDLSFMGKFMGVITSPYNTFLEICKKPTWLIPMLISIVVSVGVTYQALPMIIEMSVEQMQTQNPNMGDAQIEQAVSVMSKTIPFAPIVTVPLMTLITAGLMMLIGTAFMGGKATFKTLFSVVAWGAPVTVIIAVIQMVLRMATGTMDSATSLLFLAPDAARDSVTYFLLSQVDLLTIWAIAIAGFGFAAAYKFEAKRGLIVAFVTWIVVVAIIAGFKIVF
ncbi:MAG: YIP1 family protein [Deferribacteres bacterium]|nr:YIP1 family protein [candidate division KSB1 bacterium]MCB9501171.1 YIP1 family protein [Deferribacteres bacterium]